MQIHGVILHSLRISYSKSMAEAVQIVFTVIGLIGLGVSTIGAIVFINCVVCVSAESRHKYVVII